RPFIVQTENAQVRVLGTKFDLKSRRRKTQLVVEEGIVALRSATAAAENSVIVRANEMSLCFDHLPPQKPERVNAAYWLGWLRNKFVFDKMPLQEAAEELQRFYDFEIKLADPELGKLTITGEFEQEPLEDILSVICRALNLKYRIDGKTYFISG
ncbi:MAG: FecR family protein, partial [bacterium]